MYKEDLGALRTELKELTEKIQAMQCFIRGKDYQDMDKTQQCFYDQQLEAVKNVRKFVEARENYYRYEITKK